MQTSKRLDYARLEATVGGSIVTEGPYINYTFDYFVFNMSQNQQSVTTSITHIF